MAGFEHHIKGEDRLKEKIADRIRAKGRTPAQALAEIKAYERIRSTARDDERAQLKEFQRRVNSMIPIPPGALEIEDYPPGET